MFNRHDTQSFAAGAVSYSKRIQKVRMSHLLIYGEGTAATLVADLGKLIMNLSLSGAVERKLVTQVPLYSFVKYANFMFGSHIRSTTGYRILIPIGSLALDNSDMVIDIVSSANTANIVTMQLCTVRLDDNLPILEYIQRTVGVEGAPFDRVLALFDMNAAYNSAIASLLTWDNGNNMTVYHSDANALADIIGKVESATSIDIAQLLIDKDCEFGRMIKVEPSASCPLFVVQRSILN